jgi:hypothetical protein
MNKRLIAVTLLLCFAALTVSAIPKTSAQTYQPGVAMGDVYKYISYSYWTTTDAYSSIPDYLVLQNKTVSTEVRISEVNDTYVTTFTATYYTDADPYAIRGTLNILTGDTPDGAFPAIIAGGLNAGELIHPSNTDGITINETVTMDGRPTNRISLSFYNATSGITSSDDRYFDQATGMLVQETQTDSDSGSVSGVKATASMTMTLKSSPWNEQIVPTPEFPPILALPIFIGATTLILIALKKKNLLLGHSAV